MLTNCPERKHESFSFQKSLLETYDDNALMDIAGNHLLIHGTFLIIPYTSYIHT